MHPKLLTMNRSSLTAVFTMFVVVSSFQTTPVTNQLRDTVATGWPQFCMPPRDEKSGVWETKINSLFAKPAFNSVLVVAAAFLLSTSPVNADEYGRETEAPTLFTGETEMICTKRGPLGACLKTEYRTAENDNDKSESYFQKPTQIVKRKDLEARMAESSEGNALVERLKQQSEDNREKNDLLVQQKTFMNDKSASFGPFDRQILILNEDGKGFTLLENPQAMRLKDAGLIKDKKFVRQPTEEELQKALEAPEGGLLQRFFGE